MDNYFTDMKDIEELFSGAEDNWCLTEDEEGEFSGDKFNYHFVLGNEKIVFIKAGAGGSERGYQDKYVRMAERINERSGATVICASNPMNPICDAPDAQEIRWAAEELGLDDFELCLVGVSDGAYLNLDLASQFPEATKWVGINASFISVSNLEERLNALPKVSKIMIYGTNDDDYDEVVPALKKISCENFELKFVDGADHGFTDMLDEFISLADYI